MNWNWNPPGWKTSTKILLGIATIWPVLYMYLFMGSFLAMFLLLPFAARDSGHRCGDLDVFQLDDKIKAGEIKQLKVTRLEIVATDRLGNCEYHVSVANEATQDRIVRTARELKADGNPRVPGIEQEDSEPELSSTLPIGFAVLFVFHLGTMFLMMALMPLYIVLAVKDERHDQTMRIIWAVLMATMGMFAMPVYWYLYVWRKPRPAVPPVSNPI